jgi:hypothetical protein
MATLEGGRSRTEEPLQQSTRRPITGALTFDPSLVIFCQADLEEISDI